MLRQKKVKIKKLNENAIIPTSGSEYSAGMDLYACIDAPIRIPSRKTVKIGTGLSIQLPKKTFGAIAARSGLATKEGLRPSNCLGIADSDYTGEYIVALYNDSNTTRTVNPGDRIAQLVVMPYIPVQFIEVDELEETKRGDGGFGSTGKN